MAAGWRPWRYTVGADAEVFHLFIVSTCWMGALNGRRWGFVLQLKKTSTRSSEDQLTLERSTVHNTRRKQGKLEIWITENSWKTFKKENETRSFGFPCRCCCHHSHGQRPAISTRRTLRRNPRVSLNFWFFKFYDFFFKLNFDLHLFFRDEDPFTSRSLANSPVPLPVLAMLTMMNFFNALQVL